MSLRLQPVDLGKFGWRLPTKVADDDENGILNRDYALQTPLESLTKGTIDGEGVFDVLMRGVKEHLSEEYEAKRITGKEYSNVYLGAMTAVLQTSTNFLLNEQTVQKINAEIGLVRQQTVTELANTDDNIPEGLGFNHIPKVKTAIPPVDFPGGIL